MANSDAVDLMGLGQHCSIKLCNKRDFLPFECSKCHDIFWYVSYIRALFISDDYHAVYYPYLVWNIARKAITIVLTLI